MEASEVYCLKTYGQIITRNIQSMSVFKILACLDLNKKFQFFGRASSQMFTRFKDDFSDLIHQPALLFGALFCFIFHLYNGYMTINEILCRYLINGLFFPYIAI